MWEVTFNRGLTPEFKDYRFDRHTKWERMLESEPAVKQVSMRGIVEPKEGRPYRIGWIGVDQSYARTGISVVADNDKVLFCASFDFKAHNFCKREVRLHMRDILSTIAEFTLSQCSEVGCVMERIRIFSGKAKHVSLPYIKGMGALNATIADVMAFYGVPAYSVDTRAWKARIVGTCAPEENGVGCPPNKWPTVKWASKILGMKRFAHKMIPSAKAKKGTFVRNGKRYKWDDDAADSLGIAFFGLRGYFELLKKED